MRQIKSKASSASKRAISKQQKVIAKLEAESAAFEKAHAEKKNLAVITFDDEGPDHHFQDVILSKEEILKLQDEIYDFFGCSDLDGWKWEMQNFLAGWTGSKISEEMSKQDRSEKVFSYYMIVKFMEKLAPIYTSMRAGK